MFPFNQRGNVSGILFAALLLVVSIGMVTWQSMRSNVANRQLRNDAAQLQVISAAETALVAFRLAEISYIEAASVCSGANTFMRALKEGAACDVNMPALTIFKNADDGTNDNLYSFPGPGCTITKNSSDCSSQFHRLLIQIGPNAVEAIDGNTFKIYLNSVNIPKQVVEMQVEVTTKDKQAFRTSFGLRDTASNYAHIEGSGTVTQEQPDPLAKCAGAPWAPYSLYNPAAKACQLFGIFGSGTGLAFYNNRYFGFRPADGQIVDLLALGNSAPYIVAEDGTLEGLGGPAIFPAYDKSLLTNTDDITLVDQQIYYVDGQGSSAEIGALVKGPGGAFSRLQICNLAGKGWEQAYSGIAALSWSEPLVPLPAKGAVSRVAMFMLKTDSGDMLTALVLAKPAPAGYSCFVAKESAIQQVEYKRSLGFDRTVDEVPFFIF